MHKIDRTIAMMMTALGLLLGSWDHRVALFMDGDPQPIQVYSVKLELLPSEDQEALRNGIPVESSARLQQLLEDLLS